MIQYAVETLKVKHIIICGHYNCGGIKAAHSPGPRTRGLLDHWLQNLKQDPITSSFLPDKSPKCFDFGPVAIHSNLKLLAERNVLRGLIDLSQIPCIQEAWQDHQDLELHGWVYDMSIGHIK